MADLAFRQPEYRCIVSRIFSLTCVFLELIVVNPLNFLQAELLDEFTEQSQLSASQDPVHDIGFGAADFTWSAEISDNSAEQFRLHIEEDVRFKEGGFNLIVGPTGCGKTSMLMAMLGEMHFVPSGPSAWVNLPRTQGVAYAAQEAWVENATIKACLQKFLRL